MCEDNNKEVLGAVSLLENELHGFKSEVSARLSDLEVQGDQTAECVRELDRCFQTSEYRDTINQLDKVVRGDPTTNTLGLSTIIYGSKALGVEPIRDTLNRVALAHDRWRWLAGVLGISTIGSLIAWIAFLLSRGPLP